MSFTLLLAQGHLWEKPSLATFLGPHGGKLDVEILYCNAVSFALLLAQGHLRDKPSLATFWVPRGKRDVETWRVSKCTSRSVWLQILYCSAIHTAVRDVSFTLLPAQGHLRDEPSFATFWVPTGETRR